MQGDAEIQVTGNLGADPALDVTRGGQSWTRFTVVTSPRYLDKEQGKWCDGEPTFWRVVAWGELAEHICQSLNKGDRVTVAGTVTVSKWERDGKGGLDVEVRASEVAASLRWKDVKIVKAQRASAGNAPIKEDDPWASQPTR